MGTLCSICFMFGTWKFGGKVMFVSLEKEERRVEGRGWGKRAGRGEGSEELFLIPLIYMF